MITKEEDIAYVVTSNPAVQLLRLRNAHWVLPFLYQVFKEQSRNTIQENQLSALLTDTLNSHVEGTEDLAEAKIIFGENEEVRSRKYILNWVQKRILQDFLDAEGNVQYQLSAYSEKAFQWLLGLQTRRHVGTESRFKLLFSSLRDIVENTEDDKAKRVEMLKDKRAEIDREIKALEYGFTPDNYTNSQVQERLELFTRLCYELISDFREVEDNFRDIHRAIVEKHTKAEQTKGAIVGYAFEAYDALRNSSQGKSFYAFWDFLISRAGQQDWTVLTEQLLRLLKDRKVDSDELFLQNTKSFLLQQGKLVYEANDKMAEKLSKIITEKEIAKHKRLRHQISLIKEKIFQLMDHEQVSCGIFIEKNMELKMVMDRRLQLEQKSPPVTLKQPTNATEIISDPLRFSRLINTSHIDRKKLWHKVQEVLKGNPTASLKEVLEEKGLEHGLAEVVSFYGFLKDKPGQVQVILKTTEHIPLNSDNTKFVEVPYLLFSK